MLRHSLIANGNRPQRRAEPCHTDYLRKRKYVIGSLKIDVSMSSVFCNSIIYGCVAVKGVSLNFFNFRSSKVVT